MQALGCPLLDMHFAMAGLGEDEREPDTGELAVADPLMKMVTAEMLFENTR